MTIGTSDTRRMDRHTSKPSMPGSMMSMSTTSAGCRWKAFRASSPVSASSTDQPSSSSASLTAVRMRSSSSTDKMRVPTLKMVPHVTGARAGRPRAGTVGRGGSPAGGGGVLVGVGGEEGLAARASARAVVQSLGELGPQVAAPHQRAGAGVGVGVEGAQVDLDAPGGPGVERSRRGVEQRAARGLVEAADDREHDGGAFGGHVDGRSG